MGKSGVATSSVFQPQPSSSAAFSSLFSNSSPSLTHKSNQINANNQSSNALNTATAAAFALYGSMFHSNFLLPNTETNHAPVGQQTNYNLYSSSSSSSSSSPRTVNEHAQEFQTDSSSSFSSALNFLPSSKLDMRKNPHSHSNSSGVSSLSAFSSPVSLSHLVENGQTKEAILNSNFDNTKFLNEMSLIQKYVRSIEF